MKYDIALTKIGKFIDKKFKPQLDDEKAIIYVDGKYGVGKSHLGNEIIKTYKNKTKSEGDRKFLKKVHNRTFKISLAGTTNINEINKDLSKGIKSLFSFLEILPFAFFGIFRFLKSLVSKRIKENEFQIKFFSVLKFKSLFFKVIIIVDEIDRKCDSLDLNCVFAALSSLAIKNTRIIIIGDTNGIINNDERLKTISYRDKICSEVLTITEPAEQIYEKFNYKKRFAVDRFPRIVDVTKNLRVISKTKQTLQQIGTKLRNAESLAVEYVLLCYYQNLEDGYFIKARQKILNPVDNQKGNSTVLISNKYYYCLNEYLKRQNLFDESIIFTLISDGTFNLRQVQKLNEILSCVINLEEINLGGDFKAINSKEATFNKNVLSCINKTKNFNTSNPLCTEFTCDLLYCLHASDESKKFISILSKFQYPIDFHAFIASSSKSNVFNALDRIGFEEYAKLE